MLVVNWFLKIVVSTIFYTVYVFVNGDDIIHPQQATRTTAAKPDFSSQWNAFNVFVEKHFESLPDRDMLVLGDGYSRILGPILSRSPPSPSRAEDSSFPKLTRTNHFAELVEILVSNKLAQFRHVNYHTISKLFELVYQTHVGHNVPLKVLETGSAAYGTKSSYMFAELVNQFGGTFDTVDRDGSTADSLRRDLQSKYPQSQQRMRCWSDDSVNFIKNSNSTYNVVYLDSFDLSSERYRESAEHGLNEMNALISKLEDTSFILIDDTPSTREIYSKVATLTGDEYFGKTGHLPGKGELILQLALQDPRFTVIEHEYQLLLLFKRRLIRDNRNKRRNRGENKRKYKISG